MEKKKQISRREFFRTCGRMAIAGGMAAFATVMWKRKENKLPEQRCINQGFCGGCLAFNNCKLPQALSAKKIKNG